MKRMMNLKLLVIFFIMSCCLNYCLLTGSPVFSAEIEKQQVPLQILRYQEVYNIGKQLSDKLWGEHIPYEDVPVLAYDLAKQEEFLINHPDPNPENYEPTDFIVNEKRVYEKRGELTMKYPGGQCGQMMDGYLVVTMGYGEEIPLESLVQTFIHEGFHHWQYSSLYQLGLHELIDSVPRAGWQESPRTAAYDEDLIVEGKLFFELTNDDHEIDYGKLDELVSTEIVRKRKLSTDVDRSENFLFLTEGTAVYVELTALNILMEEGVDNSMIPPGADPNYTYFAGDQFARQYQANLQHYGPTMLRNKINLPSTAMGEVAYRYALALVRVLEKTSAANDRNWSQGLFPFVESEIPEDQADEAFYNHLDANNLSARLVDLADIPEERNTSIYDQAKSRLLSPEDIDSIQKKIHIEENIDSYPPEDGWTYRGEAGQFLLTYFDWLRVRTYCDNTMGKSVYFEGLIKLETPDKRLTIEKISIPVVSMMFTGSIRFKDIGHSLQDAHIKCTGESDGVYEELQLKIDGLELTAKNVKVTHDQKKQETLIQLM